jgi:hypothetical protein
LTSQQFVSIKNFRIILSERGTFLGKSSEQFRIIRKDRPKALISVRKEMNDYLSVNSILSNIG